MFDPTPETAVIGIALMDRKSLDDVDALDPEDFRDPRLGELWTLIRQQHQKGQPHDLTAIIAKARVRGVSEMDLRQIAHEAPVGGAMAYYADTVAQGAVLLRLQEAGTRIVQMATEGDTDQVAEMVEEARSQIDAAGKISGTIAGIKAGDYFAEFMEHVNDPVHLTPTPWPSLDHLIGGLRPGAVYVIGARPAAGKSVVGLQLGCAMQRDGGTVLFSSLEMTRDEITKRLIAMTAEVPLSAFDSPLSPAHLARIQQHQDTLQANRIHLDDRASITPGDIRSTARSIARRGKLSGIVVDYLQLMESTKGKAIPRHEAVAAYSRSLKMLAKELHVPVVVLSQLNRGSVGGGGNAPRAPEVSDLRESGAIEQDADCIVLLHADKELHPGSLFMKVGKNRQGATGSFELAFEGHYARANEMAAWTPPSY
ncbi:replicative DNA helicase [Brachybacterium alimentarium]|uniref:replicative DNA helicase n=1 Tax=Brachybacterium alimentarium TaxID=47845 RepID=UPI003FD64D51